MIQTDFCQALELGTAAELGFFIMVWYSVRDRLHDLLNQTCDFLSAFEELSM